GAALCPRGGGREPARDRRQPVGEDGVRLLGVLPLKRGGGSLAGAHARDSRTRFVCRPVEPRWNGLEEPQDRIGVLLPQVGREAAGVAGELLGDRGGDGGGAGGGGIGTPAGGRCGGGKAPTRRCRGWWGV